LQPYKKSSNPIEVSQKTAGSQKIAVENSRAIQLHFNRVLQFVFTGN
jgi:hypothetical protein